MASRLSGFRLISSRRRPGATLVLVALMALCVITAVAPVPAVGAGRVPSAPTKVSAKVGDRQVTVFWQPPATSGGARVDRYRVARWRAGTTTKKVVEVKAPTRELVVRPLTNGVRYVFQVAAHTKHGWGAWSKKRAAVPRTTPGAPVAVKATPERGAIGLVWSAPETDGGSGIRTYAVRLSDNGGRSWTPAVTGSGTDEVTTTSTVVEGLTDGSPYDGFVMTYLLQVRASNVAGWGPWATARLAPDALVQMPPFVPGNQFGDAAAAALRDRLTGSGYASYPTSDGAGEWHDGGPLTFVIPPSCGGNPTIACPGGAPQDPSPTLVLDLDQQPGDAPRRTVINVTGASRYDLTYRARVSTPEPVAISYFGANCTLTVDSTQGTSPDLRIDAQLSFADSGWQTKGNPSSVSVSGLEGEDYTLAGGFACQLVQLPASMLQDVFEGALQDHLVQELANTCGADAPIWWQPCYPILENPPPPPPPAAPRSSCPAGPPAAGPYLTVTCDGKKLVRTCATGWLDADGLVATGCERSTAGVVPVQLGATTAQALADHLSGSFFLGGYPGGVGTGSWYAAPDPVPVTLPACPGSSDFGCPHGVQQVPLPTLALDLDDPSATEPQRQGSYDASSETTQLVLRGPARLTAPVSFVHGGVACQVAIDTNQGAQRDVGFMVGAIGSGPGPMTISGYQPGLQGLEDADITIGPHRWCEYWASSWRSSAASWVASTLLAWAQVHGALCGAPAPYYWQQCP